MTLETNFYYQDAVRDYFDNSNRGRGQNELLRDQMMEDYMLKKRMKRKVRNDYEEHDEFETEFIYTQKKKLISKKLVLLGVLGLFAVFCALNRRKTGKNPIILVKDAEYKQNRKQVSTENAADEGTKKKKKKGKGSRRR
jgi:hypothetical protein